MKDIKKRESLLATKQVVEAMVSKGHNVLGRDVIQSMPSYPKRCKNRSGYILGLII